MMPPLLSLPAVKPGIEDAAARAETLPDRISKLRFVDEDGNAIGFLQYIQIVVPRPMP